MVAKNKQYGLVGQEQDTAMLPLMTQKIKSPLFGATKYVDTEMPPLYGHVNQAFGGLAFGKKNFKYVSPNEGQWRKKPKRRGRLK